MKIAFGIQPFVALAAGLSALAGCGVTVQPIDVMEGCPEMPLRGPAEFAESAPAENMIDDFEDGEVPALPMIGGRNGAWIGHRQLPPPGSDGFCRNINHVRRERDAVGAPDLRGRSPLRRQLDRHHAGPVRFGDALQRAARTAASRSGSRGA